MRLRDILWFIRSTRTEYRRVELQSTSQFTNKMPLKDRKLTIKLDIGMRKGTAFGYERVVNSFRIRWYLIFTS